MPGLGFVDTALKYGQSVYGPGGGGIAGQLAAMPSIHVAWAAIIAWSPCTSACSRWRWLFVVHFVMTVFVVVATANHWWLDGIVALCIVALSLLAQAGIERATARYRASRGAIVPGREPPTDLPAADPAPDGDRGAATRDPSPAG